MSAARPSDSWDSSLTAGSGKEEIQVVLSSAKFPYLEKVALHARKTRDEAADTSITCTIDPSSFACGFNNVVLEVAFSDGVYWIARVQHVPVDPSRAREHAVDMLSEIATIKTIKNLTSIPVPQVFAYDISSSNEFGYPYTLMECLNGRTLSDSIARSVPSEYLPKVARQLADVLFQLEKLTFDRLGRIWCGENCDAPPEIIPLKPDNPASPTIRPQTSLEWFYAFRQEENRCALEQHPDDREWKTACWILKTALSHIILEDRIHGPFPLCHLDLHYGNLLFDDDYNLKGVIDWSQAQTVPLERLAVSPEFITFPGLSREQNDDIINFRDLTGKYLQQMEKMGLSALFVDQGTAETLLSDIFGSRRAEITHRCTYSFPHRALWDGQLVSQLIHGDDISWDQLVNVYGKMELY